MKKVRLSIVSFILMSALIVMSSIIVFGEGSPNLIKNPSFEVVGQDGIPVDWRLEFPENSTTKLFMDTVEVNDGSKSIRFESPDAIDMALTQYVKVQPGKSYEFRVGSKITPGMKVGVLILAHVDQKKRAEMDWDWIDDAFKPNLLEFHNWDGAGSFLLLTAGGYLDKIGDSWVKITIPEDCKVTELQIQLHAWFSKGTAWIDNVRLIEL